MEQEVLIRVGNSSPYKSPLSKCSVAAVNWRRRSRDEMSSFSTSALKVLKNELHDIVQNASGELVGLLQERQSLQEEIDIRSITIEQLLKFAEKRQLQLGEPLAIQMSIVRNQHNSGVESGLG